MRQTRPPRGMPHWPPRSQPSPTGCSSAVPNRRPCSAWIAAETRRWRASCPTFRPPAKPRIAVPRRPPGACSIPSHATGCRVPTSTIMIRRNGRWASRPKAPGSISAFRAPAAASPMSSASRTAPTSRPPNSSIPITALKTPPGWRPISAGSNRSRRRWPKRPAASPPMPARASSRRPSSMPTRSASRRSCVPCRQPTASSSPRSPAAPRSSACPIRRRAPPRLSKKPSIRRSMPRWPRSRRSRPMTTPGCGSCRTATPITSICSKARRRPACRPLKSTRPAGNRIAPSRPKWTRSCAPRG